MVNVMLKTKTKKIGSHSKKRHGEGALKEREVAQKQEQFLLQHSFS